MDDDDRQDWFDFADSDATGAARASDPQTSKDAAASIEPSRLHAIILAVLQEARTGLTTHEIAHRCGIGYQTITPRMPYLVDKGLVFDTGLRRVWHGAPGSPETTRFSIVWQLTALKDEPIPGYTPDIRHGPPGARARRNTRKRADQRQTAAILEALKRDYPDCLLAAGLEDAIIGIVERATQPVVACYDYEKCVSVLMKTGSMSDEEAREYLDFNTVGAWMGEHTPVFLHRWR